MSLDDMFSEDHFEPEIGYFADYATGSDEFGSSILNVQQFLENLKLNGLSREDLLGFHPDLTYFERESLLISGIPKETANRYCPLPGDTESIYYFEFHNRAKLIEKFLKEGICPEDAKQILSLYDERFENDEDLLYLAGCKPEDANQYPEWLESSWEVLELVEEGIKPEDAKQYPYGTEVHAIIKMNDLGIMPRNFKSETWRKISPLLKIIFNSLQYSSGDVKMIDAGSEGIIITYTPITMVWDESPIDRAIKISPHIENEARLLKKVNSPNVVKILNYEFPRYDAGEVYDYDDRIDELKGELKVYLDDLVSDDPIEQFYEAALIDEDEANLLRAGPNETHEYQLNDYRDKHFIWIEFISGETLEQRLEKGTLSLEDCIAFSYELANGLADLRKVGIYHRDLHTKNIMIDYFVEPDVDIPLYTEERAVIIDLGMATDDLAEISNPPNRAYGNNDLISLGLLLYKMRTGHNLFNEETGFSCYSEVKEGIKTARENAYESPAFLQEHFSKVRRTVEEPRLTEIIISLLDRNLMVQPTLEEVQEAKNIIEQYYRLIFRDAFEITKSQEAKFYAQSESTKRETEELEKGESSG